MLRLIAKDISGDEYELDYPIRLVVNVDENAPADDMNAVLPLSDLPELDTVTISQDNKVVFTGPVDEQQSIIGSDGSYTRIVARSMAAHLLDNESKPVSYTRASASVIFARHLLPNGITSYKGGDIVMKSRLNVPKGSTDWQVFSSFCLNTVGKLPRIEPDGTANFMGVESERLLRFSNTDGINYISVKENNLRCKLLSDVYVRLNDVDGYAVDFEDSDAKSRALSRRRYLDASGVVSPVIGDKMIENARKSSYEVTVVTPEALIDVLGADAEIDCELKLREGLYVSSVYFNLSPAGQYTTLKLRQHRTIKGE